MIKYIMQLQNSLLIAFDKFAKLINVIQNAMMCLIRCVSGNPIRCSCLLQGLKIWTQKSGIKLYGACAWPPHLSDEPLENVQEQDLRCRQHDELIPDDTGGRSKN